MAWWWILENCLKFLIGHLSFSLSTCTSSVFPPKSCISLDFTAFTLSGLPMPLPLPRCCSSGQGLKPGGCSDCPDQREAEAVLTVLGGTPRSSARYEGCKTQGVVDWKALEHWKVIPLVWRKPLSGQEGRRKVCLLLCLIWYQQGVCLFLAASRPAKPGWSAVCPKTPFLEAVGLLDIPVRPEFLTFHRLPSTHPPGCWSPVSVCLAFQSSALQRLIMTVMIPTFLILELLFQVLYKFHSTVIIPIPRWG